MNLTSEDQNCLLKTAKDSIIYGLEQQRFLPVDLNQFSALLQTHGASFVTLHLNKNLRGCIGTLEAYQPLITDISEHAYAAAFQDPRFPSVSADEIPELEISISILTAAEPVRFVSEADLLKQLQPGIDGIILQAGPHKATFLPSVWEQLPSTEEFLNHLKIKAGLNMSDWPENLSISRYRTINLK
ncbi:MAG: AMMECR1 domain-containing protein [endosymbiont of Galathealinum brachiosum]|uniref:AMMECR1 domain-containing protein n=1 Tax=endosymbiont of Galathealinum brachiosum TaxID=2200906 RepID=A0A370DE06_9GAMM|nr:MAG: AMMECR1 domain-containing protein [endosymbiont of Galathealinum brachiosum]